jgi:hypothetical protein
MVVNKRSLGMAAFGPMNYCRLIGIRSAMPKMLVTNLDLESVESHDSKLRYPCMMVLIRL